MNKGLLKTLEITVSGRVQGVGFRYSCQNVARELGVRGWVSNQFDGSVVVVAVADQETLDRFLAWLKNGPPVARVSSVDTHEIELNSPPGDFQIR